MENIAPRQMLRDLFAAFRNRELLRWVILTELADLCSTNCTKSPRCIFTMW
jgi:hypothetical protein